MKLLFVLCTALFWLAVGLMGAGRGGMEPAVPTLVVGAPPATAPKVAPPAVQQTAPSAAGAGDRAVSLKELARHATPADCWMAIGGQVYDLSAYLPKHPSEPELIEPWCGRDATEGWTTKGLGRAHSARAAAMLPRYRIGRLG